MSTRKSAYALLDDYENLYQDKYGKKPNINRYRDMWGMKDLVEHVGLREARKILRYYFVTGKPGHPIDFFVNNYDKLIESMELQAKDSERRKKLLAQTEKLVRESNVKH